MGEVRQQNTARLLKLVMKSSDIRIPRLPRNVISLMIKMMITPLWCMDLQDVIRANRDTKVKTMSMASTGVAN
jgi:hypothetical protein